ncbi:condensation domain-containing protein [Nevskia sp.]|uniref:condensation domain-containing protein n=1 Tax=Nevskia sp. TaxID=1929292 RepID=UPI0034585EE6
MAAWATLLCGAPAAVPVISAPAAQSFEALPLTQAQLGVLQGQRMAGDDSVFHAAECIEINGPLDVDLFTQALDATLAEASSLHLRLFERDGQAWQQPIAARSSGLQLQDLSGIDATAFEVELASELTRPFDPEAGLLFEHRLYRLDANRHCWLHRAHHLLLDGYGFQMIARRVAAHYQACLRGESAGSSPFTGLQAVVAADIAYQQSTARAVDRQFWLDHLVNKQPRSLAASPIAGIARGRRHGSELPIVLSALLKCRAAEFGLSWPELITAGFAGYLAIYGHGRDVVLGMPVMQRLGSAALTVPCTAMNVMPLPLADAGNQSLALLTGSVRMSLQRQRPHQRYRFEHLEHDLETGGYNRGLLATEINVMPFGHPEKLGPCRLGTRILAAGPVEDLAAIFVPQANSIGFDLDGRAENYSAAELAAHSQRFAEFFGGWLEQPWMTAAELI